MGFFGRMWVSYVFFNGSYGFLYGFTIRVSSLLKVLVGSYGL